MDLALEILEREWNPKGFTSRLDEAKSLEEVKEILKTFLEEENKNYTDIIDIEKEFVINIEGVNIKGRIDRIDKIKDKDDFIVIDYKTAKSASSTNKLKEDIH